MVALLGALRKQMNGAVLDMVRYYGADYGMNYGVAIHSLRDMAAEVGTDDEFARYLYLQQVRELRIIALWCADSEALRTQEDMEFWGAGIINSELAEQAAQALLSKAECIELLLEQWCGGDDSLRVYAALLASSRAKGVSVEVALRAVEQALARFADNRLVAQGAVALVASHIEKNRPMLGQWLNTLGNTPSARIVREEIEWRLEY